MADHYLAVLNAFADHPEQTVGDVALLGDAERAQLASWGACRQAAEAGEPIHRLIERQVRARPEASALCFGEQTLSYGELNTQANRLAHRLIARGVKPETKVGIALERSIEMVVGILAILKAGGAYVPLDPAYPRQRLAFMLEDSAPVAVLAHAATAGLMAALASDVPAGPTSGLQSGLPSGLPRGLALGPDAGAKAHRTSACLSDSVAKSGSGQRPDPLPQRDGVGQTLAVARYARNAALIRRSRPSSC